MSSLILSQKRTVPCKQQTQHQGIASRKGTPLLAALALGAGLFTQQGCVSWSEHQRVTGELRSQLSETQGQLSIERNRHQQVRNQVQSLANFTDTIQTSFTGLQGQISALRSGMNALVTGAEMNGTTPSVAITTAPSASAAAVAPVVTPLPASTATTATN